jgi:hypothetical protein
MLQKVKQGGPKFQPWSQYTIYAAKPLDQAEPRDSAERALHAERLGIAPPTKSAA